LIKQEGTIEFGTYPSPEFSENKTFNNSVNYTSNKLYSPITINSDDFKSGRSIMFTPNPGFNSAAATGVYSYTTVGGIRNAKTYVVKLWHQLSNGLVDLTEDVQNKYVKFRQSKLPTITDNYWFNQADFVYFCPNQYKGKLAMSVELEPIKEYELVGVPTLTFDSTTQNFKYEISVKADYGTNSVMSIPSVSGFIYIGDTYKVKVIAVATNSVSKLVFTLPKAEYNNEIIRYEIYPNVKVGSVIYYDDYRSFPLEFTSKYIISGERFVTTETSSVVYELVQGICNNTTGIYTYRAAILKNSDGQNVDKDLMPTGVPHAFMLSGYTNAGYTSLGTYTIGENGKPVISSYTTSQEVAQVLESKIVSFASESCIQVTATIKLSQHPDNISVSQGGETLTLTPVDSTTYTCLVVPNQQINISVQKTGFVSVNYPAVLSAARTIRIALVADLDMGVLHEEGSIFYNVEASWGYYDPNLTSVEVKSNYGGIFMMTSADSLSYVGVANSSKSIGELITITTLDGTSFDGGNYDNIAGNPGVYRLLPSGYIFKEIYEFG